MTLYRDMSSKEREAVNNLFRLQLKYQKAAAEIRMEYYDKQPPEHRAR